MIFDNRFLSGVLPITEPQPDGRSTTRFFLDSGRILAQSYYRNEVNRGEKGGRRTPKGD